MVSLLCEDYLNGRFWPKVVVDEHAISIYSALFPSYIGLTLTPKIMKNVLTLLTLIAIMTSCGSKQPVSPRMNHVFVQVSDLEKSIKFYTNAFDLQVTDRLEHFIVTNPEGNQTEVSRKIALLKFPGQDFVFELGYTNNFGTLPDFAIYDHVGIDVKDIDEAVERAVNAGAELATPVHSLQTKGLEAKFAHLKGPDGELIELHQILSGEF